MIQQYRNLYFQSRHCWSQRCHMDLIFLYNHVKLGDFGILNFPVFYLPNFLVFQLGLWWRMFSFREEQVSNWQVFQYFHKMVLFKNPLKLPIFCKPATFFYFLFYFSFYFHRRLAEALGIENPEGGHFQATNYSSFLKLEAKYVYIHSLLLLPLQHCAHNNFSLDWLFRTYLQPLPFPVILFHSTYPTSCCL